MSSGAGWAVVIGFCIACRRPFGFNANKVPSLRWPPPDGPREPVCRACVERINPLRIRNGMPVIEYDEDAYEPFPAEELRGG